MKQEDNTTRVSGPLPRRSSSRRGRSGVTPSTALIGLAIGLIASLSGCSGSGERSPAGAGEDVVRVFAAASLTDVFGALETAFEAAHAEYDIQLNLAGSATLQTQILGGAPADVFASANTSVMEKIVSAKMVQGNVMRFATNRLLIAAPADNQLDVQGLADFERADLFLGLCAEGVPCGDLAAQTLADAGIIPEVDTYEPNVRALLSKVSAGELDAGLVYATDIATDPDVIGIELADELTKRAAYPIAVLADAAAPDGASAFVDFVVSPEGQRILADHGFGAP